MSGQHTLRDGAREREQERELRATLRAAREVPAHALGLAGGQLAIGQLVHARLLGADGGLAVVAALGAVGGLAPVAALAALGAVAALAAVATLGSRGPGTDSIRLARFHLRIQYERPVASSRVTA